MKEKKSLLQLWHEKSSGLSRWFLPVAVCFLEFLFHFWIGGTFSAAVVLNLLGFSLVFGGILNFFLSLLSPRANKWACSLCILLCVVVMTGAKNLLELYPEKNYGFAKDSLIDNKKEEVNK